MQYTETQLSKLIEDVEKEFTAHLAKSEDTSVKSTSVDSDATVLAKAEEEKKPFKPEDKKEEKPEASPEEKKPEASAQPQAEAKPEGEAPAPQAPAQPQAAAKPEDMVAPQGHDYDAEDLEHMRQMYASMSQEELKAHHDCIASLAKCGDMQQAAPPTKGMSKGELKDENPVLNSKPQDKGDQMFNDKQNGGIEGSAPHNSLGAKSPASDANGAKINKSEHDRRNGGKEELCAPGKIPGAKSPASDANGDKMNKSEVNPEVELLKSEIASKDAKYDDLKKQFDGVAAFLTKLVEKKGAPAAKAITNLDVIAKSEDAGEEKPLSKGEINAILNKKSSDPTLKKSDRDAINTYYLSDNDIKGISHLLK